MAREYEKKRKTGVVYLLVLLLILLAAVVWGIVAKYTQRHENQLIAEVSRFYLQPL